MTLLWLVLLPMGVAIVVLLLRALPVVANPLTAATLFVLGVLCLTQTQGRALLVWGRPVSLTAREAMTLAFCAGSLAVMVFTTVRLAPGPLDYPLTLAAMSFFVAATMVRNVAIAGLLLEMGAITAVMLIPSRRPGAAMTGMRTLVLLVFAIAMLIVVAWSAEGQIAESQPAFFARASGIALLLGFGIGLTVVPFHIWLPPVFRHASPLAAVMLSVVLSVVVLLRLENAVTASMGVEEQRFVATLLTAGGVLTVVGGGIMAMLQRSVSGALAYAAIADWGFVLVGHGIGSETSVGIAKLHEGYRGVGIVAVSIALALLRHCLEGDDLEHLRGAMRRAPLAVMAMVLGGLSLSGLPLTAGFSSRLALYNALAGQNISWAIAVIVCSIGPVWAFARCIIAALASAPTAGGRHEPLVPALIALLLGLALLALGISPSLWRLLPSDWLSALLPGVFVGY